LLPINPAKVLSAFFAAKRDGKYWSVRLEYDELDTGGFPEKGFARALNACGPPEDVLFRSLWEHYEILCAPNAALMPGRWKWWWGHGLSQEFVYKLRALAVARYARAREVFATYVPSPKWPGVFMPPAALSSPGA
jgi:hypothetical protein